MSELEGSLNDRRLGIVGKGGSGKSTIAVLLAGALRRCGYEVCLLDADSTNLGLHRALGLETAPIPLLDYYGGMIFSGGQVTCPVDDPLPLRGAQIDLGQLALCYRQQTEEGIYLLSAGKIGDKGAGAGCDGPVAKIARDVRFRVGETVPTTLVDFKAGIEDAARGAITGLDWLVVVVDPTLAAIQMAVDMHAMVTEIRAGGRPATRHLESPDLVAVADRLFRESTVQGVSIVLNRIRDDSATAYLSEQLAKRDMKPVAVIPEEPEITRAWLMGEPIGDRFREKMVSLVHELESALREAQPVPN